MIQLTSKQFDDLTDAVEILVDEIDEAEDEFQDLEDLCYAFVDELEDQDEEIAELQFDLDIYKLLYDIMVKEAHAAELKYDDLDEEFVEFESDMDAMKDKLIQAIRRS
jgi:predicted  nucleic acid-binding Zn-ribbon protein